MVNAREARLGCGIKIRPGDGTYVVAHYSLRPGEKFKLNDFTPSKDVQIRKQAGNELTIFYLLATDMHLNLTWVDTLGTSKNCPLKRGVLLWEVKADHSFVHEAVPS